jgi:ParB family transcriptional regulator, chromosome partitioning protein
METKQIKKSATKKITTKTKKEKKPDLSEVTRQALKNGIRKYIPLELIDDNPRNRKYYKQRDLEDFAKVLKTQGQFHEVIVVENNGRYKLVTGHRRTKSSRIAGLPDIYSNIVIVTEAQEKEIMFSENKDRVDPHPLDDAALIASMQEDGHSMQEIALRLVKPLSFIYSRIKLNSLIEPFKEMFVEDKMKIKEALQLAALSADSQQDFFNDNCLDWRENDEFSLDEIDDVLSNYLYDLNRAPFDTSAKKLVEGVGACTKCKYNSASVSVLFPELAEESICGDKGCYNKKCTAHYHLQITAALMNEKPEAVIFTGFLSDDLRSIIKTLPETAGLPTIDYYYISAIQAPDEPQKETYSEFKNGEVEYFDKEGYQQACAEYESDKQEFELMIHSGNVRKGLFVGQKEIKIGYFKMTKQITKSTVPQQTKKEVTEAIKTNTATPEILENYVAQLNEKKIKAAASFNEKVLMNIHKEFTDHLKKPSNFKQLVDADIIATRILIYDWLIHFSNNLQQELNKSFGIANDSNSEQRYGILAQLSEEKTAYLIRKAVEFKSNGKSHANLMGLCLYKLSENWGIKTKEIEAKQQKIQSDQEKSINDQIDELQAQIETLKLKAA